MENYFFKQSSPFIVPTEDGKLIEEHFGKAALGEDGISIAHMIAPPGWEEPFQNPEFDEYTLMVRGKKRVLVGDREILLKEGESLLVRRGSRVKYSNPFKEPAEYWSVCLPAFSLERVKREG
mgnify:CR=1 FL=1